MAARATAALLGPLSATSRWRHAASLAVLALVAALHLTAWWAVNRPATSLPDWNGRVAGLAFAPYQRGQSAETDNWPSAEEIAGDLRRVAPLTGRIRTYTVQRGFDQIPELAQGTGLRVTLGAWLDGSERDAAELKRLAETARRSRNVDMLMVGNESVLRGDLKPAQLAAAIRQVRAAGVRQPVSTAEPWHVWLDHPELAEELGRANYH